MENKDDKSNNDNKVFTKRFTITLIAVVASLILLRVFVIDIIHVSGDSMHPTLLNGEFIVAEKVSRYSDNFKRGEVVIVQYPNSDMNLVKRIIGLEGESIYIKDNVAYINGEPLQEDYISVKTQDMREVIIPKGHIFVMGDNRNFSSDSREPHIGAIPYEKVVGHGLAVVFPFDKMRQIL